MTSSVRYVLGSLVALPLLPIMYLDGKKIRKKVPRLPEAKGTEGISEIPLTKGRIKVATLGESTIAGVGADTHTEGFTGTLASELSKIMKVDVEWSVYARSGYTVSQVTERLLPKIKEQHLDLIVVGIGGNDAFSLNNPWKWRKQVKRLIKELRMSFPETLIVFANMPPIKEFPAFTRVIRFTIGNLVEILGATLGKEVRNHEKVYYSEEVITLKEWQQRYNQNKSLESFFSDGVHPSILTYQIWATDLADKITSSKWIKYGMLDE